MIQKPTLHMIGLFHTICNHTYDHCAFTGKVWRFSKMMREQGYTVIEYSNGESLSEANEHVQILTAEELYELTKNSDNSNGFNGKIGTEQWRLFEERLIPALASRIKQNDIICHPYGPSHKILVKTFPECFHVETGIGYNEKAFGAFRIFESYAWMHYHQGMCVKKDQNGNILWMGDEPDTGRNGSAYEWVVPNYYNIDTWEPNYNKGEYLLYFGRILELKGLNIIKEIGRCIREPIKIVGLGDPTPFMGTNIEYYPPITGDKARSDLLRNAKALIMPTQYVEPFGGSAVEAMLCGTPVISSDFGAFTETIEQGKTGFRCHTLGDYLTALSCIDSLDRKYISDRARELYSIQTVGKQYDAVFKQISDLANQGWYTFKSYTIKEKELEWEKNWWGNCTNTFDEEQKQYFYAKYLGLSITPYKGFKTKNEKIRVLDVGGGPVSMLLKLENLSEGKIYDPIDYPEWTKQRYLAKNIDVEVKPGEEMNEENWDEVWIYNCLQHVRDPEQILKNVLKATKTLRIFEWINTKESIGHNFILTKEFLEKCIGQEGKIGTITEDGYDKQFFYGLFTFK